MKFFLRKGSFDRPCRCFFIFRINRKEGIYLGPSKQMNQTYEEWYVLNAKPGCSRRLPELMYSETVSENSATIVDHGYFLAFLTPEESISGQLMVVAYQETTVYARETDRGPGKVLHSETVVIGSL